MKAIGQNLEPVEMGRQSFQERPPDDVLHVYRQSPSKKKSQDVSIQVNLWLVIIGFLKQ